MRITKDLLEKAYKKLKSSVYYDKTQLALRNNIVRFEQKYVGEELDEYLKSIFEMLKDEDEFNSLSESICDSISVISFPKTIKPNESDIIMNSESNEIEIEDLQFFIDMPVEGHILGVLWIMLLGYKIDETVYEHSYGNRIRKKLINDFTDNPTFSPYLFEPYFEQYESWRDNAMSEAQKHMGEKQDVVIITMDFRRYYYSLDVDDKALDEVYKEYLRESDIKDEDPYYLLISRRLNSFIGAVISRYSKHFGELFENRKILPIGFLPSNILGNWCLHRFDKAVIDGWNPVYYGRYVDDILIVDKIEHNSELFKKAKDTSLTKDEIISYYLTSCSKWNGINGLNCENNKMQGLFIENEKLTIRAKEGARTNGKSETEIDRIREYSINPRFNPCEGNKSEIAIQNKKVKVFYFKWDESDSLITCFKSNISKNKSEFRHLPEDEAVFQSDDYSDIYSLKNSDTVNKIRGIDGIEIDKYELSKFLGKYLRIGGMIRDKAESRFEKDIIKVFNARAIIENYSAWEKIIEILIINERFSALKDFCYKINKAIETIHVVDKYEEYTSNIKNALYTQLHSCLCRNLGLVWKKDRKEVQNEIYCNFLSEKIDEEADELIQGYCRARMLDKSVMPILIDMLCFDSFNKESDINLTRFGDAISIIKKKWDSEYKYYPYLISKFDFDIISCIEEMNKENNDCSPPFRNMEEVYEDEMTRYITSNYLVDDYKKHEAYGTICIKPICENPPCDYYISVGNVKKHIIRIAIANVKLNPTNFDRLVKECPNRSYLRYKDLSQIVNSAIDQKADMLIMPEAYVPFEWLSTLARTCAKNKLAIVTGVEHVIVGKNVFNITAIILPYSEDVYKCAHISFHLKKHYAPSEIEKIEGYRLHPIEGKHYELYKWYDCYFAVYCCYELTSIYDRSRFQSYADLIVAVEWNRDVKYYSNILESLSRDIHCYCIQVNSSEYGDSRITKPSKSEEKDVIRTKGGINSGILVEDIDISELRNFQIKEYSLQQKENKFKATPPDFIHKNVLKKIKGEEIV